MAHPDEGGVLGWLDGPRLVVIAAGLFMFGLFALLLLLWSDQRDQVERIDKIVMERQDEAEAANRQQVINCFSAAAEGPALQRVLEVIERESDSLAIRNAIADLRTLNDLNAPTLRECRRLADRLNVPIPKGIR